MRDVDPSDIMEFDDEELAILAIIRAKTRLGELDSVTVHDEDLAAYVLGTATPAQSTAVQAALASSPELSRITLELMRSTHASSGEARAAFDQAPVPPLERFSKLTDCVRDKGVPQRDPFRSKASRSWVGWVLGGWAVTATATACALFLVMTGPGSRLTVQPSPPVPEAPPRIGGTRTNGSKLPPSIELDAVPSIALANPSRSGAPSPTAYRVNPSTKMIRISVDAPEGDAHSAIQISVIGPDGARVLDTSLPPEAPFDNLILTSRDGFKSGTYTMLLEVQHDSHLERVSHRFVLDVASPK